MVTEISAAVIATAISAAVSVTLPPAYLRYYFVNIILVTKVIEMNY